MSTETKYHPHRNGKIFNKVGAGAYHPHEVTEQEKRDALKGRDELIKKAKEKTGV